MIACRDLCYDWVANLVNAMTYLGWSEDVFWKSTPRKFYACFYTYVDLQVNAAKEAAKPQTLVGRDAIDALASMAKYIR